MWRELLNAVRQYRTYRLAVDFICVEIVVSQWARDDEERIAKAAVFLIRLDSEHDEF